MTPFTVVGINHIGLASKDPAATRYFFEQVLGLPLLSEELVSEQKTNTYMYPSASSQTKSNQRSNPPSADSQAHLSRPTKQDNSSEHSPGPSRLEILEPEHPGSGPIGRYLDKKGGGIHHLALQVDNLAAALTHLAAANIKLIDSEPKSGAHGSKVAFVHPHSTGGILIELVEP